MNAHVPGAVLIPQTLDYHQVAAMLPFGTPWLLIDRVLRWDQDSIVVQKALSGGEVNMATHLKEGPSIAPGVLQIELVAQALTLLMVLLNNSGQRNDDTAGACVLARCKATFHSPAYIGEVITAEVKLAGDMNRKAVYEGVIKAGSRLVSEVRCVGALIDNDLASPPA